ncbi:MAG: TIGR01777 family oxidoreductase [Bdellovibrionales bacterium]|nr:TIGR01777 family oxidoreductase [Bdellovibrionales bacterium]
MRILLTGATGLIGKEVGKRLVRHGHQVVAVTRSASKASIELPFQAELVEWNGRDVGDLLAQNHLKPGLIDGVIHLMGENVSAQRWTSDFKKRLVESRVQATQLLVEALGAHAENLKFWIQGSAIGLYGTADLSDPADESTVRGHGFLADLCANWEAALEKLSPNVRRVITRTGVVMSHRGGAFGKMLPPILQGAGGSLGSGNQAMSLIHLEDMVGFIEHAVDDDRVSGVYNLVCHEPTTQRLLTEKLCQKLHVKMGPPAPAVALRLMFGEMASIFLDSVAVKSNRLAESGYRLQYADVDSIVGEITSWHQSPVDHLQSSYVKYEEQFVPQKPSELFKFFGDEKNLEKITPEFLNFRVDKISTPGIQEGTEIRYKLSLHGIPFHWLTRIESWEPPKRFVDHQKQGPYSLWYHEHQFEPVPGGTLIRDWIRYRLPLGRVGQWVGYAKVKSDVERIFQYRREVIGQKFGHSGCS